MSRLCLVNNRKYMFHKWVEIEKQNPSRGTIKKIMGLVEDVFGFVELVEIFEIRFIDNDVYKAHVRFEEMNGEFVIG